MVRQNQLVDLTGCIHRNESQQIGFQPIFRRNETAVAHAVTAFIGINRCPGRHRARIPDGIPIFNIVILSVRINRKRVVTITGDTKQFRIFIETITTTGVGNQRKESVCTQIVDPWKRSIRGGNHIFSGFIIKMSKFHNKNLRKKYRYKIVSI